MNTKKMTTNAILIAVGAILHYVTPMIGVPMQPDFALAMLFIIMVLNSDYKTTLICGIVIGIFTALTTKTPGGQIPNITEKIITSNIMYLVLIPLRNRINKTAQMSILLILGTLVSGTTFLLILSALVGLTGGASIMNLFIGIVLPTVVLNLIIGTIIYKIVEKIIIKNNTLL